MMADVTVASVLWSVHRSFTVKTNITKAGYKSRDKGNSRIRLEPVLGSTWMQAVISSILSQRSLTAGSQTNTKKVNSGFTPHTSVARKLPVCSPLWRADSQLIITPATSSAQREVSDPGQCAPKESCVSKVIVMTHLCFVWNYVKNNKLRIDPPSCHFYVVIIFSGVTDRKPPPVCGAAGLCWLADSWCQ